MAWKIYFWTLLLLLSLGYALIFTSTPTIWDALDVIISFTAITGLFAYAYKKQIFTPKFWSLALIVIIFWDLIYNLVLGEYLGIAQQTGKIIETSTTDALLGLLLILPEYIALYLLTFKSGSLWKQ